ncbi:membrane protein [Mycoplasmopsis maculosa]|uniref:Membrane protein n=1 Tax=Mycoplasmopsis maculosa TaxID=114885 RepID=A0A449B4X2_9BACT|nr:hypothetical protein [Mycoplasmopsis maculosa]VEU75653.1 membrane protein [Mycoplasmopsis maculosa]
MNKKAVFIPLGIICGAAAIATPIIVVSMKKSENEVKPINEISNKIEYNDSEKSFFPKLDVQDFYKYVNIENKVAKFNKKIIGEIIKTVFKKMILSSEKIKFNYRLNNDENKLDIIFMTKNGEKDVYKKYIFKIDDEELKIDE